MSALTVGGDAWLVPYGVYWYQAHNCRHLLHGRVIGLDAYSARVDLGSLGVRNPTIHGPYWQYVFASEEELRREARFAGLLWQVWPRDLGRLDNEYKSGVYARTCWGIAVFAAVAAMRLTGWRLKKGACRVGPGPES